ncbi:unnamed protein product [Sphenostylis stenocarpa]|uniref:Uncharacterized protein n=1 Tax=Sphenostylis stenocarpa TaxID=92480 RepID=A0AA86S337_9FABA|nr:unnamed protein product [Sphenostylis stenocarpa]
MMSEGGKVPITREDALAYLKKVKDVLQDKREEYDYFMTFHEGFPREKMNIKSKLPLADKSPPPRPGGYEAATNFVNKVKVKSVECGFCHTRFHGNDHVNVYRSFLDIMNTLSEEKKSITEAYKEVCFPSPHVTALFQGHEDFLGELKQFFPGTSGAAFT